MSCESLGASGTRQNEVSGDCFSDSRDIGSPASTGNLRGNYSTIYGWTRVSGLFRSLTRAASVIHRGIGVDIN
jgi:hypothetical protein